MLKAPKKLTKKEIKQDKLVTYYFKAQDFFRENGQTILLSAAALVIAIALIGWFTRWKSNKENEAELQLAKARIEYFSNNFAGATPLLQTLVNDYDGTDAAGEGLFYLGNSYYNLGNYGEAEKYYKQFLQTDGGDILKSSAISGMAACLEQRRNYRAAAKLYEEAAEKYSDVFLAPGELFNAARCRVLSGDKEGARELLGKLLSEYQTATIKGDAEIMLAEVM